LSQPKPYLICLFFMLASLVVPVYASGQSQVISIDHADFSKRLAYGVEYLEDVEGNLTLDEVQKLDQSGQFTSFTHDTLQMGYSHSAFWIKLIISNQLPDRVAQNTEDRFFLSVLYPLLDDVRFYHLREQENDYYDTGDSYPFQHRFLKLNHFTYPFTLSPGEQSQIFIRVQTTSSVSIPLYLATEQSFIEQQHKFNAFNGIYFGISLGLGIYNLFLWVGVHKKVYGLYVLVIINLVLFNATLQGYSFRFWPDAVAFQQYSIYLFSTTASVAVCLFGIAFLRTREHQPKLHRFIKAAIYAYLLAIPAIIFAPTHTSAHINVVVTLTGVFIIFVAAIRSVIQGYAPARYYLVGQGAVLFSVIFTVLTSQGILPLYYLAPELMKWASAFELIFFSIGVTDLINTERKLRERAQQESNHAHQRLLKSQIEQTEKLDNLVRLRTEELEDANTRLQELSTKDELTGLRNRRYLNEILPQEYRRAYRDKKPISLLIFDIDFFKKINDSYGHQFGDLCLIEAGRIIRDNIKRPADIAFRYGGEEFMAILPQSDLAGAIVVAENIRRVFANHVVSNEEYSTTMTISIGISSKIPTERDEYEDLLKLADQRLYKAKENGRNQIIASDEITGAC
jgi:two-component system, sensor histidine kinase LadS